MHLINQKVKWFICDYNVGTAHICHCLWFSWSFLFYLRAQDSCHAHVLCTLLNDTLSKMCNVGDRKNGVRKKERERGKEGRREEGESERREEVWRRITTKGLIHESVWLWRVIIGHTLSIGGQFPFISKEISSYWMIRVTYRNAIALANAVFAAMKGNTSSVPNNWEISKITRVF